MKNVTILISCLFLISISSISKGNDCNGETNEQIAICTKNNFKSMDGVLNAKYSSLISKLPSSDQIILKSAEKNWISYKEKYCQEAFDITSPGQEAGIDKWQCLYSVTSSRVMELEYIDGSRSADDFFRSVKFIADNYEHGDIDRVIKKMAGESGATTDDFWGKYVRSNCSLTHSRLSEESDTCAARLSFYRDWR